MGLFIKKRESEQPSPIIKEKEKITMHYLRLVSAEYYGHCDFDLKSPDKEPLERLYGAIKEHIGTDYILEAATNAKDCVISQYSTINLKFYAYVQFGNYLTDKE